MQEDGSVVWRGRRWSLEEWREYERRAAQFEEVLGAEVSRIGRERAPKWSWDMDERPAEPRGVIRWK